MAELGLADRLTVILGEEVSTADGEVVGVFLQRTIPRGLSADETADAIHDRAAWSRSRTRTIRSASRTSARSR